jgi:hypothetical protein
MHGQDGLTFGSGSLVPSSGVSRVAKDMSSADTRRGVPQAFADLIMSRVRVCSALQPGTTGQPGRNDALSWNQRRINVLLTFLSRIDTVIAVSMTMIR